MIRAALDAHAAATQRTFAHSRHNTVGASEVGRCARQVYFQKSEGDAHFGRARDVDHVDGWGAKVRGTVYEDAWWYPALRRAYGDRLLMAGRAQRTLVKDFLSATPDGLLVDCAPDALAHLGIVNIEGTSIGLECKTADPRTRLDGPKPEHVFQAQVQMGLMRETTNHSPSYAVLSYTDASFWDVVREFPIAFDPVVYIEAKGRARDIMLATDAQQLRPEGVIAGGQECERCAFTAACGRARAAMVPKNDADISDAQAHVIAQLAIEADGAEKEAKQQVERAASLRQLLRERLTDAGRRKLKVPGLSITWSSTKGRASWDYLGLIAAAAAAGVETAKFKRMGDAGDRMTITRTGASDDRA